MRIFRSADAALRRCTRAIAHAEDTQSKKRDQYYSK